MGIGAECFDVGVEGVEDFHLDLAFEAATLAPPRDHLVGKLLGRGRYQVVIAQGRPEHDLVERLGA